VPHVTSFAAWLQSHIERLDTNITGLSRLVGVSQSSVSQWMSGSTMPSRDSMLKLARVLGVHPIDVVAAVYEIEIPGQLSEQERATIDLLIRLGERQQETLLRILDVFRADVERYEEKGIEGSPGASAESDE